MPDFAKLITHSLQAVGNSRAVFVDRFGAILTDGGVSVFVVYISINYVFL